MRPHFALPIISERLALRPLAIDDAPALLALYSDPEVMRYWSHAPWTRLQQAEDAIADARHDYAAGRDLHLAIEHRATATLIGSCALFAMLPGSRRATIGYLLARQHWGQGYLNEILGALVDYGMGQRDLQRIEAEVDPRNTASIKALGRVGFLHETELPRRWQVGDECMEVALYVKLRKDWTPSSKG
jgi:RimJ/RimL family protein N-acetyltransferase